MKFVADRPSADRDIAARKLIEVANGVEVVQDGRVYAELVNARFLAAGGAGNDFAPGSRGPLLRAGSGGTRRHLREEFTEAGAALFDVITTAQLDPGPHSVDRKFLL